MKRIVALTLALAMALLLAACSGTPVISPYAPSQETAGTAAGSQTEPSAAPSTNPSGETSSVGAPEVKTGLAIVPSVSASKDAGEEPGLAQSDITLVAVLVDDSGVITDCVIDSIQAKISFGADGGILTDLSTIFPTKNELGTEYGMIKASGIGKEWNQQMAALAEYAVGKTVEELQGIALNEKGAPADADLAASVTVSIGGTLDAIALAVENAAPAGAVQGDTLALGAVTNMASSKAASVEEPGVAQAYATVTALTTRNGVITSCIIDAVQCNVNFDISGKITTDLSAPILTKNQLGDGYGMAKASSIGKEWYEQAAAFAQYVVGKTAEEVNGIAVNEQGAAADADLAASVTLSLGSFQQVIAKAAGQ
ncbi:MAG TPA: hypothetical protein IAC31_02090 [Candidatus Faecousia intestinigallinarum]|nr:hypothetical protein [Candidatus Faecousia intestinigallinarum]